jgi:hypothetical protein
MMGLFYSRVLPALLAVLCIVLGKVAFDARMDARRVPGLEQRVSELTEEVTARGVQIAALEASRLSAEDLSAVVTQACTAAVRLRQRHIEQSREIERAPDDRAAADAYRRLLCDRPEASGHPACGSASAS